MLDASAVGAAGSRVEIVSVGFPETDGGAQIIEGDAKTAAKTPSIKKGYLPYNVLAKEIVKSFDNLPLRDIPRKVRVGVVGDGALGGDRGPGPKSEARALPALQPVPRTRYQGLPPPGRLRSLPTFYRFEETPCRR